MGSQMALLAGEVSLFDMNSWWWAITKGLYWVIDAIQQAYGYLVGTKVISNNAGSTAPEELQDILFLNITDSRVQNIFLIFFIVAAGLLLIFLGIGMIKANFQGDDQLASRWKMVEKSFQAFFVMLLLPIIMYIGVAATGAFLKLINGIMSNSLDSADASIAQNIHEICLPDGIDPQNKWDHSWNVAYSHMQTLNASEDYQYVLAILSSGILIYVLIAICTSLVERLIEIVFFYLIAPFVLARTPLDDGGSYKLWKDIVIAKMLSAAGIIISMYLYIILLQNINTWFKPASGDSAAIPKNMVRILFTIGGAFAVKKGALSVAQVISQNTGISEGMSQGQSLHMLSSGLGLGMSVLRGGIMGMALAKQTGTTGTRGALKGITSGSGRAMIPASTSDPLRGSMGGSGSRTSASAAATAMPSAGLAGRSTGADGVNTQNANFTPEASSGAAAAGGASGSELPVSSSIASADTPLINNAGVNIPANDVSEPNIGSNAPTITNATPAALPTTNNLLTDNPNVGGDMGKLQAAQKTGGGLGTAFLYGGGAIGGIVSAAAYLGSKAVRLALKPVKWAAGKAKTAVGNSSAGQWAKGQVQTGKIRLKAWRNNAEVSKTQKNSEKLNAQIDKTLSGIENQSAKLDNKYSAKGYSSNQIDEIKRVQLSGKIKSMDRKIRRLTNAGMANTDLLQRYNNLMNTNHTNNDNGGNN